MDRCRLDALTDTFFTVGSQPMTFTITTCWATKAAEMLILRGGGKIVTTRQPHAIRMAAPNDVSTAFKNEDVFSVAYILECCNTHRILDLTKFRCHGPIKYPGINPMDVLLRQKQWPDPEESTDDPQYDAAEPMNNAGDNNLRLRRSFTVIEDQKILEYIIKNNGIGLVEGNSLWEEMAQQKVCNDRTWQSMKKHFLQQMLRNISQYSFLRKKHIMKFEKLASDIAANAQQAPTPSTCASEEAETNADDGTFKLRSSSKCVWSLSRNTMGIIFTRSFTASEDKKILQHIIKNNGIGLVGENDMWKEMAQQKVCSDRTWQSMKKHFVQQMLPNISQYTFLRKKHVTKFQELASNTTFDVHSCPNEDLKPDPPPASKGDNCRVRMPPLPLSYAYDISSAVSSSTAASPPFGNENNGAN